MVILTIVPFYASLLALLYFFLSVRVIRIRRLEKIPIGDRDNPRLLRVIRAHSNFSEYVPLALILITFVELQGLSLLLVHGLGLSLLVGRAVHAYGVIQEKENYRFREVGMFLTFGPILIAAAALLYRFIIIRLVG
jgi:uncharacterized membrane protein YecN with MAPEG domain